MQLDEARARTAAAYNLAADNFDDAPLGLWARAGSRTVERLALAPGKRVLDVCCGSGSTAIPAAEAVGPFGTVLGVDLSEELLALASAKAAAKSLKNIEFRCVDIAELRFPKASCDAVICQFGIFQLPDMGAGTRLLWSLVAPGGVLAVTTWGPRVHEPIRGAFWAAVRARRPDLIQENPPTHAVATPERLRRLFIDAEVLEPEIVAETTMLPLDNADAFWMTLMGSGNRRVIEALGPEATAVRDEVSAFVSREGVTEVETIILYAVARRPGAEV
ncbi:MAG TPA: methyltransferase domain-containing protein [Candidatus Dormibacteraeota bacterium]|jgi:ubiquinone/menaquinone biosynthesis C-methylase UbiE